MQLSEVVLRPVITEQSVAGLDEKKYTFEVDRRANKTHIKQAVEAMFEGVKVKKVNTINVDGKAVVTLTAESKDIELFANEAE